MESAPSVVQLVKDISARFPIDAQLITARIAELGYEPDAFTAWFEQFSQRTTASAFIKRCLLRTDIRGRMRRAG